MPEAHFHLASSGFENRKPIPAKYTCEGQNVSPPLHWDGAPPDVRSFVLILDDPDAPRGTFTHWVLFDIPGSTTALPEGVSGVGTAGRNDFRNVGYGGPCPPPGHGDHRYFFRLYALDVESLRLKAGAARAEVEQAMKNHVLGRAEWMGTYRR